MVPFSVGRFYRAIETHYTCVRARAPRPCLALVPTNDFPLRRRLVVVFFF